VIISPCQINFLGSNSYIDINNDKVCIYGRKGVSVADGASGDRGITTGDIALVSEEGEAAFNTPMSLSAGNITIQGKARANIGPYYTVNVTNLLKIFSTGTTTDEVAIYHDSNVTAGEIQLTGPRRVFLDTNTAYQVSGPVTLTSTNSSYNDSNAYVKTKVRLTASDLRLSASKFAGLESDVVVILSGAASIVSRDAASSSVASLGTSAHVTGQSMTMTSGNKATLGGKSRVDIAGNFQMSGAVCSIANDAVINAGSVSGSCLGNGPVAASGADHTAPESYISSSVPLHKGQATEVPETALFELGATDTESGVKTIFYSIDKDQPAEYIEPFDLSDRAEGKHKICFFSRDDAGNEEAPRCIVVRLKRQTPLPPKEEE
jgi:hypothetical protein